MLASYSFVFNKNGVPADVTRVTDLILYTRGPPRKTPTGSDTKARHSEAAPSPTSPARTGWCPPSPRSTFAPPPGLSPAPSVSSGSEAKHWARGHVFRAQREGGSTHFRMLGRQPTETTRDVLFSCVLRPRRAASTAVSLSFLCSARQLLGAKRTPPSSAQPPPPVFKNDENRRERTFVLCDQPCGERLAGMFGGFKNERTTRSYLLRDVVCFVCADRPFLCIHVVSSFFRSPGVPVCSRASDGNGES